MKKLITLTVFLAFTASCFCQQLSSEASAKLKTDYMKRSKRQAVAGWILAAGGSTLLLGTFVLQSTEDAYVSIWEESYFEYESGTNYAPAYIAGAAILGSGIGLLIASSVNNNKAKAITVNLHMQNSRQIRNATATNVSFPAVSLKLSL